MAIKAEKPGIPVKPTWRDQTRRLINFFQKRPVLLLSLVLFIALFTLLELSYRSQKFIPVSKTVSNILRVVSMSPEGNAYSPKTITFTFSEPVDPHAFEHYFEISHQITGQLQQGASSQDVIFTPNSPLPTGATISIKINKGLLSTNGKPLMADYYNNLKTGVAENQIQFVKNNVGGRVLSYTTQEPVKFHIRYDLKLQGVTTHVYRSDKDQLFRFLTYGKKDTTDSSYYYNSYLLNDLPREVVGEEVNTTTVAPDQDVTLSLTPGIYYAKAFDVNNNAVGSTFILVSSKGLIYRQDDRKITLSAFDYSSGRTIDTPLSVSLYSFADSPSRLGGTEVLENQQLEWNFKNRVDAVIGTFGSELVFVPVYLPQSQADIKVTQDLSNTYKIFIYTDRPIYKPSDTVKYRGTVRVDNDSLYSLPPAGTVIKIAVNSYSNNAPLPIQTVYTDGYGIFFGELKLPETAVDVHYLKANMRLDSNTFQSNDAPAYFDVAKYIKPEFDIKSEVAQTDYLKNETLNFTVTGKYFDGRPLSNTQVSYKLFTQPFYETERAAYNTNFNITAQGGMCGGGGFSPFDQYYGSELENGSGTVQLGPTGQATVSYKLPEKSSYLSQKIVLVANKTDGSGNEIIGAVNTLVHGAEHNIFFIPSKDSYRQGEEIVVPFYAEKLTGEKLANSEFIYKLDSANYSGNTYNRKSEVTGTVTTDGAGIGIVKFTLPNITGTQITLSVEKADSKGNVAKNEKNIYITNDSDSQSTDRSSWNDRVTQTYLKITASANTYKVGDTVNLAVVSPKELDVFVTLERGRIYAPQRLHLTQGDNQFSFPVDETLSPSLSVMFSFFADNQYHSEGVVLNVPAMHKLLSVEVSSNKAKYTPDETAELTVSTKDADGVPTPAKLSLAIVDKAIFALRKNATPPIHSSFYYFRPRRTNASSSLTAVGDDFSGGRGGGGGGGESPAGKLVDTLYWNPSLETDATGLVKVSVPLRGITTTWKAQAIGSTDNSLVGQGDTEFLASP